MSNFTILIHIVLEVLASAIDKKKKIKIVPFEKEEKIFSSFPDDIIYVEKSQRKLTTTTTTKKNSS